jgi:uncharacterized protein involved in exopolysaccharide biosynthesis
MEINLESFKVRQSIAALLHALRRHLLLVAIACAGTVALMMAYMYYFPPVYRGSVKLLVESEKDQVRSEFYDRWNVFRGAEEGETEAELLRVAPVIKEVVVRMNLKYEDVYHPFLRHAIYLWGNSFVGSNYRKLKRWVFPVEKTQWDLTDEEIDLAKSVDDFRSGVDIQSEGNSTVARVSVLGPSRRVAEMADTLVEVYLEHRNARHRKEAMAAYDVLTQQVTLALDRLKAVEEEMKQFGERYAVKFEFEKERRQIENMATEEHRLMQTRAEVKQKEERLAEVERQLKEVPESEITARSKVLNELKVKLDGDLLAYEVALIDMKNRFTPDSLEVREAQSNIDGIKQRIGEIDDMVLNREDETANPVWSNLREERSRLQIDLAEQRKAEAEQERIVARFEETLKDLPQKQQIAVDLGRRVSIADREYQALVDKQQQAYLSGLSEMEGLATIKIIEPAAVPDKPIRPKKKLYILAAIIVGLAMGAGAALAVDYVDDRIHSRDDIERAWGRPVYAEIPLAKSKNRIAENEPEQG